MGPRPGVNPAKTVLSLSKYEDFRNKMKIASVEFIPLSLPLAAPFHPAWFPNVTQKSADGTLIKVHTDEGIVGYGWQNSFGSEIKTVGESRVFKDLVVGTDLFNVENLIRVLSGIM